MNSYHRIALILGVVMIFTLVKSDAFLLAYDHEMSRLALRDLQGVYVLVGKLNPEIEREGLTKHQIQTDVELRLRMAGIKVLSHEEALKMTGAPFLRISAHVVERKIVKSYIYNTHVELCQDVYLVRKPEIKINDATTWSSSYLLGLTPDLDQIRARVRDQVDFFINAYLSVNPK